MPTCGNYAVKMKMYKVTETQRFRMSLRFTNEDVKSIRVDGKAKVKKET